jgi:hypothetical protein
MRATTATASLREADASLDARLNPVALPSGEIVSWAAAFPRPGQGTHCSLSSSAPPPITDKPTR